MSKDHTAAPTYPPLEKPDLKSQIPSHLLADASGAEKHIISELSILRQFSEWSIRAHMDTHSGVLHTNGRLLKAESEIEDLKEDKRSFTYGWRAIVAVAGFIAGIISFIALIYQTFFTSH